MPCDGLLDAEAPTTQQAAKVRSARYPTGEDGRAVATGYDELASQPTPGCQLTRPFHVAIEL